MTHSLKRTLPLAIPQSTIMQSDWPVFSFSNDCSFLYLLKSEGPQSNTIQSGDKHR